MSAIRLAAAAIVVVGMVGIWGCGDAKVQADDQPAKCCAKAGGAEGVKCCVKTGKCGRGKDVSKCKLADSSDRDDLCGKCGEKKGSGKCCKPAAKCGKCGKHKGSPGCCKGSAKCPKRAAKCSGQYGDDD